MTDDKRSDLLRKIQGLLAKAEATEHEGERQVFMAKADELMMKYRVELWELQQKQQGRIAEREPVVKDFDYSFAFQGGPFPEISDSLWSLFCVVASHTNCVVIFHKQHYSAERKTHASRTIPVIGTESDLGYMALLFSSLMTQLIEQVRPHYDPNKTYEENLRMFKEAGWNWLETAKAMQDAGFHTDVTTDKARHLTAHAYRRWCKRFGIDQNYSNWKTYRRNFSEGFVGRVGHRMYEMREAQKATADTGNGMDLVLRDQREINLAFMEDLFPKPESNGKKGAMVRDTRKFDSAAYYGGAAAGDKANISGSPGRGVRPGEGRSLPK
jgi:hypothetical protein